MHTDDTGVAKCLVSALVLKSLHMHNKHTPVILTHFYTVFTLF